MRDLTKALDAVDAANAADPNLHHGEPLALVQGRSASGWLAQLSMMPSPELEVAARAHHLRRWEVARTDYPEGREGYLRWRRENKAHQAASVAPIMEAAGFDHESIERTQYLLLRKALKTDAETQALEDVACLVFVETQFEAMEARTERERMVNVVAKTLRKMSDEAIQLAAAQDLSAEAQAVLGEAVSLA